MSSALEGHHRPVMELVTVAMMAHINDMAVSSTTHQPHAPGNMPEPWASGPLKAGGSIEHTHYPISKMSDPSPHSQPKLHNLPKRSEDKLSPRSLHHNTYTHRNGKPKTQTWFIYTQKSRTQNSNAIYIHTVIKDPENTNVIYIHTIIKDPKTKCNNVGKITF